MVSMPAHVGAIAVTAARGPGWTAATTKGRAGPPTWSVSLNPCLLGAWCRGDGPDRPHTHVYVTLAQVAGGGAPRVEVLTTIGASPWPCCSRVVPPASRRRGTPVLPRPRHAAPRHPGLQRPTTFHDRTRPRPGTAERPRHERGATAMTSNHQAPGGLGSGPRTMLVAAFLLLGTFRDGGLPRRTPWPRSTRAPTSPSEVRWHWPRSG